jgi:hypothetical protein
VAAWLSGVGCVPLHNLMEDAATAEISRAQVRALGDLAHSKGVYQVTSRCVQLHNLMVGGAATVMIPHAQVWWRGNLSGGGAMLARPCAVPAVPAVRRRGSGCVRRPLAT